MLLRALVFDLWGTLIQPNLNEEPRSGTRARLTARTLLSLGYTHTEEEIAQALRTFNREHNELLLTGRDVAPAERLARVLELIDPQLVEQLSPDELCAVNEALTGAIRLSPPVPMVGSHEVLREADRRGLALGLISNTGISHGGVLREFLAETGLLPYLRIQIFSDELRLAKPAPEIFRSALDAIGVTPEEAAYVGDTPVTDTAGARAAGMWSIQIGERETDGVEPHAHITTLAELFPTLQRLGLLE